MTKVLASILIKILFGFFNIISKVPGLRNFGKELLASAEMGAGYGCMNRNNYYGAYNHFLKAIEYGEESTTEQAYKEIEDLYKKGLIKDENKQDEYMEISVSGLDASSNTMNMNFKERKSSE